MILREKYICKKEVQLHSIATSRYRYVFFPKLIHWMETLMGAMQYLKLNSWQHDCRIQATTNPYMMDVLNTNTEPALVVDH